MGYNKVNKIYIINERRGHESAFMATVDPYTLRDTFVSESLSYTQ